MKKDQLFDKPLEEVEKFKFDQSVADVFDDMASRSIPLYASIRQWQSKVVQKMYLPGTTIFDVGCSTGNTILQIRSLFKPKRMVGIDPSPEMLTTTQRKLNSAQISDIELLCLKAQDCDFTGAGVVLMNYTLQFIEPQDRLTLLQKICQALPPKGVFLFSEKVVDEDQSLHDLEVDLYYDFKRLNGYSELEIAHKREALEKVLIPDTIETHKSRLAQAGFSQVLLWNKWFNFASFLAIK